MGIDLRPVDKSHVPALARLHREAEAVDDAGEHYNEADLEEELANPDLELGKDVVGAFDGDELVGYFSVLVRKSDEDRRAYAFGVTHPERRGEGIGTLLADGMMARAAEIQQSYGGPLRVMLSGVATNTDQAALAADMGLAADRWSFSMRTMLADVPAAPAFPDGYAVRLYAPDDAARWLAAHNLAFRDHPNFAAWDESEWQQWVVGSRNFRPALSFFVTPSDDLSTIAAYVQTNEFDAYTEITGRREAYVGKVGTLPGHRGRGLASTLLRHCLVAYRDAGFDEAALDVDSLNPTGALGIYERAGFAVERKYVTYVRVLMS
jgi:mycothiol synthase